jgi:hypothetical protein
MTAPRVCQLSALRTPKERFAGLAFAVEGAPRRPGLRIEAASGRRVRIVASGAPILWGRLERYYEGVWWLREDDRAPVIEPIHAPSVRAAPDGDRDEWHAHWARHLLGELARSPRCPLDEGPWELRRAIDARAEEREEDLITVENLEAGVPSGTHGFEDWGISGSGRILGRRTPSTDDDGRVKAWRKRARDGTLPPVLLMFVTAFDMHLVLDGHDRLQAALLEGQPPPMLTLTPVVEHPRPILLNVREAVTFEYERRMRDPAIPRELATRLGHMLSQVHRAPGHTLFRSRAFPLAGGVAAWDAEVAAALDRIAPTAERSMLG